MPDLDLRNSIRDSVSVAVGLALSALGMVLLVGQFLNIDLGRVLWPLFVIAPGLAFFAGMVLGGRKAAGLAIPGSIITTVGLMLLYQNISNHWESWAYAWALIPTAVGFGLIIQGTWGEDASIRARGRRLTRFGIILFLIFGTFFELILNLSGFLGTARWLWPLLMIGAGVYLLISRIYGPLTRP